MNTLIIYCHPHAESHCRKILGAVQAGLDDADATYETVDLYAAGFDPLLSPAQYEAIVRHQGDPAAAPSVADLQQRIAAATNLVFIYPVWWYGTPAMLKGCVDRVFTPGFAYRFFPVSRLMLAAASLLSFVPGLRYLMQPQAAKGLLRGKRAYIFRSYGGPPMGRRVFGNTVIGLEHAVLRFCGITDITIHELYNTAKACYTEAYEERYLATARQIVAGTTGKTRAA